jgi:hypothetical protein
MSDALPTLPPVDLIRERLPLILPEGIPNRNYHIREIAVRTVFVMFYIGAVEGVGIYLRPSQVRRMSDEQAKRGSDQAREEWRVSSQSQKFKDTLGQWYAADTRESIRDETLRDGLVRTGAVIVHAEIATTSGKGRYALSTAFAALFNPALTGARR